MRWVACLVAGGMVRAGLGIGIALTLRRAWESGLHPDGRPGIVMSSLLLLLLLAGEYGLRVGEGICAESLAQRYVRVVRRRLLVRLLATPATDGESGSGERGTGADFARVTTDLASLRHWVSRGFTRAITASAVLACLLLALVIPRPGLALACLLAAVPLVVLGRVLARRLGAAERAARRRRGQLANRIFTLLRTAPVDATRGIPSREMLRIGRLSRRLGRGQVRRVGFGDALRRLPEPFPPLLLAAFAFGTAATTGTTPAASDIGYGVVLLSLAGSSVRDLFDAWKQRVVFEQARGRFARLRRARPGNDAGPTSGPVVSERSIPPRCPSGRSTMPAGTGD